MEEEGHLPTNRGRNRPSETKRISNISEAAAGEGIVEAGREGVGVTGLLEARPAEDPGTTP